MADNADTWIVILSTDTMRTRRPADYGSEVIKKAGRGSPCAGHRQQNLLRIRSARLWRQSHRLRCEVLHFELQDAWRPRAPIHDRGFPGMVARGGQGRSSR